MRAEKACAPLKPKVNWNATDWCKVNQRVRRLQARIVKATNRVQQWAFERLEPDDGKLSSPVLRGGGGSNAASLPGVRNNPVRYNDPSGHDAGCAGVDAGECPTGEAPVTTVVILVCGMGIYEDECEYQEVVEGYGDPAEPPLNPYSDWAKDNGLQTDWFEFEDTGSKVETAGKIVEYMEDHPEKEFILIGHSAGADAAILAATDEATDQADIRGMVLLDPSLTATLPDTSSTDISQQASELVTNQVPVAVGLSIPTNPNEPLPGKDIPGAYTEKFPNTTHTGLAVLDGVFNTFMSMLNSWLP